MRGVRICFVAGLVLFSWDVFACVFVLVVCLFFVCCCWVCLLLWVFFLGGGSSGEYFKENGWMCEVFASGCWICLGFIDIWTDGQMCGRTDD